MGPLITSNIQYISTEQKSWILLDLVPHLDLHHRNAHPKVRTTSIGVYGTGYHKKIEEHSLDAVCNDIWASLKGIASELTLHALVVSTC